MTDSATEISGHFGTFNASVIRKTHYLGCKGSWVQIPPRRPYLTNNIKDIGFSLRKAAYPKLRYFPLGMFRELGTNSGQNLIETFSTNGAIASHKSTTGERLFRGSSLKWFKHQTDAHEGDTIMQLWASKEFELIAFYWTLLEMICKYGEEHENLGRWTVNLSTFRSKLGMNAQRSAKLLLKIGQTFKIEVRAISDESYELFAHNMLDIKERRGGKTLPNLEQTSAEARSKKQEVRIKKQEERLREPENPASPIGLIRQTFIDSYKKEFQKEYPGWGAKENSQAKNWLRSVSLQKALGYCVAYPTWNDPWVSRNGHPFGILVAQYVQLEAWLHRPESVVRKIAEGRAAEKAVITESQNVREMEMHVAARIAERNRNTSGREAVQGQVSYGTKASVLSLGSHVVDRSYDEKAGNNDP